MIISATRTMYGLLLNLAHMFNQPYEANPNTMLNEKFNIRPEVRTVANTRPSIQYLGIGVGGIDITEPDPSGYTYSQHDATDPALFEQIPFIMVPSENDIPDAEKLKYRFRVTEIINEKEYVCYYLKVINNISLRKEFYRSVTYEIDNNIGQGELSLFNTNTVSLLNPTPRRRSALDIDPAKASTVSAVAKIPFTLTSNELDNIKNTLKIRYGENSGKTISEVALCSGIEQDGREPVIVQVAMHYEVDLQAIMESLVTGDFGRVLEVGGMEPYYAGK